MPVIYLNGDRITPVARALGVEDVKVNGVSVVENQVASVTVPTKTSDITNDSSFQTDTQVDSKISTHNSSNIAHSDIRTSITAINAVIPGTATAQNLLADKAYVASQIPTVSDARISFVKAGVVTQSFTLNQASGATVNLDASVSWGNVGGTLSNQTDLQDALDEKADTDDIPTKISDLTDDTATNPVDKADTLTNLTATITELNYVDGVTSNIQTQLNGKQDSGNYAETDKVNTFTKGQVISRTDSGSILKLTSAASDTNFILERTNGSQCVLESGATVGLFGTKSNHPLQVRTNYTNRMTFGTDGSVKLATAPSANSNDTQLASTAWVNTKLGTKQDTLTAGSNITISNNTISATDTTYSAGNGLTLTGTTFSANVQNNTSSTSTTDALSANMGHEMQAEISHLQSIGRFLSFWDCTTGLPTTTPQTSPYTYKTGDYYRVGTVGSGSVTNYKPNGSSYTTGVASTTVETSPVAVGQVYYYDGTNWSLSAGGGSVSVDNSTITYNGVNEIQAVGVKDVKTTNTDKIWTGASADLPATRDANTFYNVTDDIGGSATQIGAITEALNGKADTSLSNITSEGKATVISFGFPDYSAGETATQETEYTASTNCWLYAEVYSNSNSSGGNVGKKILINGIEVAFIDSFYYTRSAIIVPCKKGDTYKFANFHTGTGTYTFKVYPCIGG